MKGTIYVVLAIMFCALQTTVFEFAKVFGVRPNLLIAFIVCVALVHGSPAGGAIGLLCGILTDVLGRGVFGINALLMLYTGVCVGLFSFKFYKVGALIAFVFTLAAFFTYGVLYHFFVFYIWGKGGMWFALSNKILPEGLYTALISVLMIKAVALVGARAKT